MKNIFENLLLGVWKRGVVAIICLVFTSVALVSKADPPIIIINTITTPPPFSPTLPSLNSDDISVSYHYEITGTGYYDLDLGGGFCEEADLDLGLKTAVEEQTTHFKTNGTSTASSKSAAYGISIDIPYCTHGDCPMTYTTNYYNCISTNDGNCSAVVSFPNGDGWDILPVTSYTNYDLGCGSLIIGASYELTTFNPAAGHCPGKIIVQASGDIYELTLTLTPNNHTLPSFPSYNSSPPPNFSNYQPSQNSMTPFSGSFDTGGHFQFWFSAPSNTTYSVFASSDLQTWENIGTTDFSGTNMQGSFVDSNAPSYTQRFYITTSDGVTAISDAFGFVKVTATTNGAIIANPLLTSSMTIGDLLSNAPNGTTAQFLGETNWAGTATFSSGSWDNPNWQLTPGNGLFIQPTTNVVFTFIGQVLQGVITNYIPSGYSVRSSAIPLAGSVNDLGLTNFANGDYILKRTGAGYSAFTNISGVWYPSTPTLAAGEAVIINCASSTSWNQSFQNLTSIDPNALSTVVLDFYYNDSNNHEAGGCIFGYCWDPNPPCWDCAPDGSVCELYSVNYGDLLVSQSATGDFLDGEGEVDFFVPEDFTPGDQGDYVHLRYRNGNICGPWSNPLSNAIWGN